MKNKIDTKKWKEYNLKSDLNFEIYHGQRLTKADRMEGNIPLLTAGKISQGVGSYIGNPSCIYKNAITVDMFGNCFYHRGEYSGDDNIYFYINNNISEKSKLYITSILSKKLINCYSYIDQFRQDDADNLAVHLPTTLNGTPDWEYMECYIEEIKQKIDKVISSLNKAKFINSSRIDIHNWKEFKIGDLFDIHPTKSYKMNNSSLLIEDGINPVIVNSCYNNGVGGYTNYDCTEEGDIITFSDTTSADSIFYQKEKFVGYPHVQGMYPIGKYKDNWSEYTYLFFITIFREKAINLNYDYVNKFTRESAKEIIIKLPADAEGNPAWGYMEKYMSDLLNKSKYKLDYLKDI